MELNQSSAIKAQSPTITAQSPAVMAQSSLIIAESLSFITQTSNLLQHRQSQYEHQIGSDWSQKMAKSGQTEAILPFSLTYPYLYKVYIY